MPVPCLLFLKGFLLHKKSALLCIGCIIFVKHSFKLKLIPITLLSAREYLSSTY